MTNPYNSEARIARRDEQLAHLETVMALPGRAQGGALFALWPDKLPRRVRRKIPSSVLQSWRKARGLAIQARIRAIMDEINELDELQGMIGPGPGGVDMRAATEVLMQKHGSQVRSLQKLVVSISQLKAITFSLSDGTSATFDLDDGEDFEDDILFGLCMALEMGAGITLRQTLSLRSQVKNDQGQMEWRAQERVYGIHCANGHWQGITAAQMRAAYEHDEAGNYIGVDPTTSFGNARDLIRGLR